MTRLSWHIAVMFSRLLEPDERQAVLGDLWESGRADARAALDVAGLALHRQAALWASWWPWALLFSLVIPAAFVLSGGCTSVQGGLDLYLWIFRNRHDLDPAWLSSIGLPLASGMRRIAIEAVLMLIKAWTYGYVIAALARRTLHIQAILFCLVPLLLELLLLSLRLRPYQYDTASGLFSADFYTLVLPTIWLICLVFLPAFWGMRLASKPRASQALKAALWVGAIVTIIGFRWPLPPMHGPFRVLTLTAYWPLGYLILNALHELANRRRTL